MTEKSKQPIELWDIDKIIPYPKNPKKHSQEQVERLARSIERFGITPLQVEGNQEGCTPGLIIAGHGRRLSIIHLGRKKAPVIVRNDLSKMECDALRISDNAAVSNDIDYDLLGEETIRLGEEGFELSDLGMTDAELKALTTDIGEIDETAFTTDITAAVEEQKKDNAKKEAEIDDKEGPVGEALGFKKVTTEQSRIIRGFMARVEAETGLKGAAALVAHIGA
jgi:hypothetical protein